MLFTRIAGFFVAAALCAAGNSDAVKAAYGNVPPLSFNTPEGQPAGFTIDVFNEAAGREQIKLSWVAGRPSLTIEAALKRGTLDIVPAGMITPDRQREFYVSAPWWFAELSLLTKGRQGPQNFSGRRLAMASPIYRFLADKEFPGAAQVPFTNAMDAVIAVCRGNADGALLMHMDVHDIFFARRDICQNVPVSVTETPATIELAIVARHGMEVPAKRLIARVDEMALDGTLAKLAARYPAIPASGVVKLADDLRARYTRRFWRTVAVLALLMVGASTWLAYWLYRDAQARKRAQSRLEVSERRLARAHRIASLGDWEIDLVTGEVDLSDRARELFEHDAEQSRNGWNIFLCRVTPQDADRVRDAFEQAAAGKSIEIAYAINHSKGGRRYIRQLAGPLPGETHIRKVAGTIQDMTEYWQLEQQLVQSQKMESIGHLAGVMAHDFNNFLTVIGGYSALLLTRLHSDRESRAAVEEIAKAADRAAALVRQLLTFSRPEISQPKYLLLGDVVRNMQDMLRRLVGEQIELVLSLDPELPPVRADSGQIEQVILNLVVNARDAMPNGGTVTVKTKAHCDDDAHLEDRPSLPEGVYAKLSVTDTGSGIEPDILPHIFEPFYTTKERGKGTGLGLSILYTIVKQSGGTVRVSTEPGAGTTFEVLLPATTEPVKTEPQGTEAGTSLSGDETVLVVEDDKGVRRFVRETLRPHGYHLLEASNGHQAMSIANKYRGEIDLLLTDVIMPGMGGLELARRFSDVHPEAVILFMSGYAAETVVQEAAGKLITKPFTPMTLLRNLRETLAENREMR